MVRMRFEALERRQMFAASTLSDAVEAYVLMNCPNDFMARPEEVIVESEAGTAAARIDVSHTYDGDLAPMIAGDDNDDGKVGANDLAGGQEGEELREVLNLLLGGLGADLFASGPNVTDLAGNVATDSAALSYSKLSDLDLNIAGDFDGDGVDDVASFPGLQGLILPYLEQDNIFKALAVDDGQGGCAAVFVADITDGTSNTMMLRGATGDDDAGSRSSLDIGEHAYSSQTRPHHDGIIAILIGLAVDPTNPNVVYVALGDGSVRSIGTDVTGTTVLDGGAAAGASVKASMLASDEFFARFSDAMIDDEAAVPALLGNADGTFGVTHDAEFESWARATRFDRGYLPPV